MFFWWHSQRHGPAPWAPLRLGTAFFECRGLGLTGYYFHGLVVQSRRHGSQDYERSGERRLTWVRDDFQMCDWVASTHGLAEASTRSSIFLPLSGLTDCAMRAFSAQTAQWGRFLTYPAYSLLLFKPRPQLTTTGYTLRMFNSLPT